MKETKSKSCVHKQRLYSEPFVDFNIDIGNNENTNKDDSEDEKGDKKDDSEDEEEDKKDSSDNENGDNGLFILGLIERAAKEKKRTKSVVIKNNNF